MNNNVILYNSSGMDKGILTSIFQFGVSFKYVIFSNKISSITGSYAVEIVTYISSNSSASKFIINFPSFSTNAGVVESG